MKDWIVARMRESSSWRGMVYVVAGLGIEYIIASVHFLSGELQMTLHLIAGTFITNGAIAVGARDTTAAGQAIKTAQAIQTLQTDPPKGAVPIVPPITPGGAP